MAANDKAIESMIMTRVYSFGAGEDGQLGLGTRSDETDILPIVSLDGLNIVSVVAGSRNSLAISVEGQVYAWGWNQRGTLGHSPETSNAEAFPSQVFALAGKRIVQASIGGWHCLAVDDKGSAYAWGGNEYGQCGMKVEKKWSGKLSNKDIPSPQPCVPHLKVKQVAAGGTHSLVLTEEGEVWTWGQPWPPGDMQQTWSPVRVPGLKSVKSIAVGAFHNLVLLHSGEVYAFGNNEYGQLGTGDTQPCSQPELITQLSGLGVVDIVAGGWHSMALTASGEVYAWGRGEHGRLGFGDDKSSKIIPHRIHLLSHETIVQVSCGGTHSLALTKEGKVYSFGRGSNGRLGFDSPKGTGYPVEMVIQKPTHSLSSPSPFNHVADFKVVSAVCGGRHNLLLLSPSSHPSPVLLPFYLAQLSLREEEKEGEGEGERKDMEKNLPHLPELSIPKHVLLNVNQVDSPLGMWVKNNSNGSCRGIERGEGEGGEGERGSSSSLSNRIHGEEGDASFLTASAENLGFILDSNVPLDVQCN